MVRTQFVLDSWKTVRKDVAAAVREFPADKFDETPIEGVDSFRAFAVHILDAGHAFSGALLAGIDNLKVPNMREMIAPFRYKMPENSTPEEIAQALEQSIETRTAELAAMPADWFDQEITRFDGLPVTRLEMVQFTKEHELTHRSQMFMLMRLKGIVPPTTKRRMAANKAS